MTFTPEEEAQLQRLAIEQALQRLDPRQRLVIRWTYWWGLPQVVQMRRLNVQHSMVSKINLDALRALAVWLN